MDLAKERPREWTKTLPEGFGYAQLKDIIYEKKYFDDGGVARITINRPERMNALTRNSMEEITCCLSDASNDKSIGVAVLTGMS